MDARDTYKTTTTWPWWSVATSLIVVMSLWWSQCEGWFSSRETNRRRLLPGGWFPFHQKSIVVHKVGGDIYDYRKAGLPPTIIITFSIIATWVLSFVSFIFIAVVNFSLTCRWPPPLPRAERAEEPLPGVQDWQAANTDRNLSKRCSYVLERSVLHFISGPFQWKTNALQSSRVLYHSLARGGIVISCSYT